ncbi:MAG TPA: CHAT domain-containing protein [Terracidiphilus sp.]|nr:CHAT domain-containing protein [Terracidiphilus sp.]
MSDWLRLVIGDMNEAEQQLLRAHAAVCGVCLAHLQRAQQVLNADSAPEERAALADCESMTPAWQHRLAVELAHTARPAERLRMPRLIAWATASATAVVILAVSGAVWWRHENAPERLLAEAYTQSRSFDLRVPGAGFAQITPQAHLRGGATDQESAPLLTARAQIERKLQQSPSDPRWLQLKARAELMDEHYDVAIDILDRLVAAGPSSAGLLLDDGTAYFLRGAATGSENDRATALDTLRRADEMNPADPIILFNEALVMEDRGQLINAVETWHRFLQFEHDVKWQEEGRARLSTLEQKLDRLKTHESRMEQNLASPQALRALAANGTKLAGIDEELSSSFLPRLIEIAYPPTIDRSRGSPCADHCMAARRLLQALATSLEQNHQDHWLTQFLPSDSSPPNQEFAKAAHALDLALDANMRGDYAAAESWSLEGGRDFAALGNVAGAARAEAERAYALQREYKYAACHEAAQALANGTKQFTWIEAQATALDAGCDVSRGSAATNNPATVAALEMAQSHHYVLLELRAHNMLAGLAVESGDTETAWRICLETLREFYDGDYPPFRAGTTMGGLTLIEDASPRVELSLLVNREALRLHELSPNRAILAQVRASLIRAALRAGSMEEAKEQMNIAKREDADAQGGKSLTGLQAETEIAMAQLYCHRGDLRTAQDLLDNARKQMDGEENPILVRSYAVARGEFQFAIGNPEAAEETLRIAILKQELAAKGAGARNIVIARKDRDLYAALTGVWFAENRPGTEILSLWERFRLRILGEDVPSCAHNSLSCMQPQLEQSLRALDGSQLIGQIVLWDRTLVYSATTDGVKWKQAPTTAIDLQAATARLDRAASSPVSSQASVDDAARRVGDELLSDQLLSRTQAQSLLLEADPLLGNVPWPAVEISEGPIGLKFNLQESPSMLLGSLAKASIAESGKPGHLLVVGASEGAGQPTILPEVLREARTVAHFSPDADVFLARQATEAHVVPLLSSATILHFAGHSAEFEGETRLLLAASDKAGDRPFIDRAVLESEPPRAAKLVVFDACSSGKQEAGWDHGMGDIVDTLTSLGVPEVVATRWQIDSASAVPMMDEFYQGLANGLSVPRALTAARRSLIRDARYRHPYYWAAYYASGEGSTDLREVLHGTNR